jgi:hypothetical protein
MDQEILDMWLCEHKICGFINIYWQGDVEHYAYKMIQWSSHSTLVPTSFDLAEAKERQDVGKKEGVQKIYT